MNLTKEKMLCLPQSEVDQSCSATNHTTQQELGNHHNPYTHCHCK